MALSPFDRDLLKVCLAHEPGSWEAFVDRFLGLVIHVVHHTAESRSFRLTLEDVEDLAHEVFVTMLADDLAVLRRFRGDSSLATYLTVIARRVVVRELLHKRVAASSSDTAEMGDLADLAPNAIERIESQEEVERLLTELGEEEREVVRLYHLDGKSYHEISEQLGIGKNTIGPILSRARTKMRQVGADSAVQS